MLKGCIRRRRIPKHYGKYGLFRYCHGLNEEAWYATQSFMFFEQSSGIHFICLFSKKEKEKSNKIQNNTSVKMFYQTNVKAVNLYCPS